MVNPGSLSFREMPTSDGHRWLWEGEVVFTQAGRFNIELIDLFASKLKIKIEYPEIAPAEVADTIRTNRIMLLLTNVALAVSFLSLYLAEPGKGKPPETATK